MLEGFIAFAGLAVLMLGGQYLLRRRRAAALNLSSAHVPLIDGRLVLRPPRWNALMLGVTALFPAVLVASLTARARESGQTGTASLLAGVLLTLLVLLAAAYAFAYAVRAHIIVDDAGIERVGVFRRRLVEWESITKVAFNPAQHWFVMTVSNGSHLWLPADLAGMGDVAVLALRRLTPATLRDADPVAREVLDELADAIEVPRT